MHGNMLFPRDRVEMNKTRNKNQQHQFKCYQPYAFCRSLTVEDETGLLETRLKSPQKTSSINFMCKELCSTMVCFGRQHNDVLLKVWKADYKGADVVTCIVQI